MGNFFYKLFLPDKKSFFETSLFKQNIPFLISYIF